MPEPLTAAGFQVATGVSRETLDKFGAYVRLLLKWQPKINLIGPTTVADIWRRHLLDSAQLHPLVPDDARTLVDLGSGAGFPGMVLAIMGIPDVHLIESNLRKATFLREVSRETATPVTIHAVRLEQTTPIRADVVTARALAPLDKLLDMARRFAAPDTLLLFPKGRDVASELTQVARHPMLHIDSVPSITDAGGTILCIKGLHRA